VKISNSSEPIANILSKIEPGDSAPYEFGKVFNKGGIAIVRDAKLKEEGRTYAAKIIY
jgi:hypothetical protein